ncbi:PREDICTED: cyclin-dependent kinase inhibitor 4-like [Brassica oleracea var. oleracea]|uniref:Cyclin-dependent kinase inhibitor domain-containing protein n=1 Tax=Brassica oleracea var. oleracea TaxID=109376 RepID=A0A0D3B4J9_BRAOL|nr:PREDICTED: cyclin-dependent kinase inhibitor 4-like [Brassica oleracea var. oleracea]
MGKYIKKKKLDGEALSLIDVSPSPLGVLTRAKSLALQRRLQKPPSSPSPNPPPSKQKITDCSGGSYLQLRSRRLQKKPPPIVVIRSSKRRKQRREEEGRNPNPNPQNHDSIRGSGGDGSSRSVSVAESVVFGKEKDFNGGINRELDGSESFNWTTSRESTPCSLIRKQETITSPGSSTKLSNGISDNSNQREDSFSGSHRHLPTTPEMDEFFSAAEEEQQKQFIEKYNFDPVNEQPLPGRFEWKKVDD